jgi:O-antigen/teichoic acid export membrane protein
MLSVITGMVYTLLITWNTTKAQYGTWINLFDLMAYFVLLASALPFWTTRFAARGKEGAVKTGLASNLIIALISVALYIPLVSLIISALGISEAYLALYLVASVQIIELYLINALEAGLRAERPQTIGYGLLIVEIGKVAFAYVLIVILQDTLLGAMIGFLIAVSIQTAYYVKLLSHNLNQKIQWSYVKEWLKGSTANIYYLIGTQTAAVIFILLFIIGGAVARGNYGAASTIASIISYSIFLSFALYPKLLAESNLKDVTTSLKMVLMFAIPMAAGALAMSDSFLIILEPNQKSYIEAAPILSLLAVDTLIATISQFFIWVLFGFERLDEDAKIPLKQLTKSSIFKVFTLPYIQAAITLPSTFFILSNFAFNEPVLAGMYVVIINMTVRLAMFPVIYALLLKTVRIRIPWKSIAKYVFASSIMATILFVIPHPTRISTTLGAVAIGGIVYLALLIAIDKETRALFNFIWRKIRFEVE